MPTNIRRRLRRPAKQLAETIPDDLLHYLRFGVFPEKPAGEPLSDIFGEIIWFMDDPEALAWLEEAWRKHEKLIRQGVNGEPYVIDRMKKIRFRIDAGRKWSPPKKGG